MIPAIQHRQAHKFAFGKNAGLAGALPSAVGSRSVEVLTEPAGVDRFDCSDQSGGHFEYPRSVAGQIVPICAR